MPKLFTGLLLSLFTVYNVAAQDTKSSALLQPYGKIDVKDLELKSCSYEKDANAMVLFNKAELYYDEQFNINTEYHKRIKIFTDAGKKEADVRIEYISGDRYEYITGLQAEIFNLNNGKVETIKLDKKQIYTEQVDKNRTAMIFSFPNVKAGSVIEYKYLRTTKSETNIRNWFFQDDIPVQYSEFTTHIPEWFTFSVQQRNYDLPIKTEQSTESKSLIQSQSDPILYKIYVTKYSMANAPSMVPEPFMTSEIDNLQCVYFQLTTFRPPYGFVQNISETWAKVAGGLIEDEDFGGQLKRKLKEEEPIIVKAKSLTTDDQKIAYLFNEVKSTMKWDKIDRWYTNDGTAEAWEKKTGNATEINLILFHLLKQSGVKSYPMLVSTRDHGRVNPSHSFVHQFNRAVVYIPVDSNRLYVLDAADKYNNYREIPAYLLNTFGLWVDKETKTFDLMNLAEKHPVDHSVLVTAQISADGKMQGNTVVKCSSYNKQTATEHYKADGSTKYLDYLRDNDNNLSITNLKMENIDVDTLPLLQHFDFKQDLAGSDGDYIYFNANLFSSIAKNPFLTETRHNAVDFLHTSNYDVYGMFKMPEGYKYETLPKSAGIAMPDKSIIFKRLVDEQDGTIMVKYIIKYNKTMYPKEDYLDLYAFYQKMYELLDEKIVLKKS